MSRDSILVGIDIGSSNIRTIIAQNPRKEIPRVVGVSIVPSFGIRRGVIVDTEEVAKVINESVEKSERMAGITVKKAVVSTGGSEIGFQRSKGVVAVGRADGEVTENDIQRVLNEVQMVPLSLNREIVHIVPQGYRLDDQENIKDPVGMRGVRLEVNALLIEDSASHVKNIAKCLSQSNIEIDDIVLEPLAAAKSVLGKKQKELGVVLVNLRGGTTSIAVFEEGELLHTAIIPVGAGHITNDIAIGLRTTVEVAEKVKLEYGCALPEEISRKEEIDLARIDSQEEGSVSRYHVAEIIEARLEEIFKLVNKELQSIKRAGLLPAGAVLTGGGAKLPYIADVAKKILGLPTQIGFPANLGGMLNEVDDPSFATAVGLILWGLERESILQDGLTGVKVIDNISRNAEYTVDKMRRWLGRFLP
ncbi:MAG: cell division protein FtsA [Candidatus Moranbacteria bacterium]|nr:cell division protein FtsA [Candidatus Moranbacteria bacterium]